MPGIACLGVPDLPLCAAVRAEPRLLGAPLAVVQAGDLGGRAHVLGATPLAEGVEAGQTPPRGRGRGPSPGPPPGPPGRGRAAAPGAPGKGPPGSPPRPGAPPRGAL